LIENETALENRLFSSTALMRENQQSLPRPKVSKGQFFTTSFGAPGQISKILCVSLAFCIIAELFDQTIDSLHIHAR
jgi:hypothetical protein